MLSFQMKEGISVLEDIISKNVAKIFVFLKGPNSLVLLKTAKLYNTYNVILTRMKKKNEMKLKLN